MIAIYLSAIDPVSTAQSIGIINNLSEISPQAIGEIQALLAKGQLPTQHMVHTFDLRFLSDPANYSPNSILSNINTATIFGFEARNLMFLLLFLGFAIKLPLVPFHTWLPDAHVEAPTAISVILAGTLLKIGGYGLIRIAYSIFPDSAVHYALWIGLAGAFSIIWGAFNSLAQKDLKRQIAFSSVSHMGFVVLGIASITAEGVNGAIFQMFSHGILSAMLFLIVGVLYYRTGSRQIADYQGIANKMPVFTVFVAIAFFASLGLPAFSGFIGEFFSLMGSFNSTLFPKYITILGALGIIIGACYFLWTFRRIFLGTYWLKKENYIITDLKNYELIMFSILTIITLVIGLLPHLIFDYTATSVIEFIKLFKISQ
jgi:NADH-quinone oxidoreductase subunit M